jgi:hypothetical protein
MVHGRIIDNNYVLISPLNFDLRRFSFFKALVKILNRSRLSAVD